MFVVKLLVLLLAVLVIPWVQSGSVLGQSWAERAGYLGREAVNPWLLPSLGLVWVMAGGGLDLSVWVVFALGAVIGTRITGAGGSPMLMLAGVTAAGVAVGMIHAAGVGWLRLPSWAVTLATATIGVSVVAALAGGQILKLRLSDKYSWPGQANPVLLTGSFYVVAMLAAVLAGEGRRSARTGHPAAMAYALIASAVLSALGGLCWLVASGVTPKPGHLAGDVRVAAAAVLAGAAVLNGTGRRMVASVLLLPAMLLATAWRQCVWCTLDWPGGANLILLVAMVLLAQWVWVRNRDAGRAGGVIWPALAVAGIAVLAGSAWDVDPAARVALRWAGLGLWAVGIIATAATAIVTASGGGRRRGRR